MESTIVKKYTFNFSQIIALFLFILTVTNSYSQVGINTTDPKSTLEINGSLGQKITTVTVSTTLTIDNGIVICNNGASPITITLPSAVGISGRIYTIKRNASSTANVTIAGTINGVTNLILTAAGQAETLFSDDVEWKSLSKYESTSSTGWSLTGNSGTTAGTNFIGTSDAKDLVLKTNNTEKLRVLSNGNVGIGESVPTAALQLKAGTTAAGTAPLKFTTQAAALATVEPGTMEYIGHSLQFSQYLKRRGVVMSENIRTSSLTLYNETTVGQIVNIQHGAGYLEVGKSEEIVIRGTIEKFNAGLLTFNIKQGPTLIYTFNTTGVNAVTAGTPFVLTIVSTCRSIGTSGKLQFNYVLQIAGEKMIGGGILATLDTTLGIDLIVTANWATANTGNRFVVEQSRVLDIEPNK